MAANISVRVLAFARVRELLGCAERTLQLPPGATVADAWEALAERAEPLRALASSTRLAQNGRIVDGGAPLHDGDEVALLPPVGGG
ncbi:MAG: MoaD/ThiS family protein [Candidatus Eremiobacteraeota bacterium]|nr:MoaD/ThiS family protein [Candidatus Eremiobacteraeota bacterium]